ncbi:AAA family ATPase [Mycolicibacterium pulveris]|nr:AAA family ATPase [Mycolicibacterium pulveris]
MLPERVSWLWPNRIPLGKLVTLDGDPGLGKSTLALTFAATVTTGGTWPDGSRCDHPGDVVLLSAEDGLADTVRPRLDVAGADVARVHAVQGVPLDSDGTELRTATLADVAQLRAVVTATQSRLVIVDVLMAYLPTGTDSHRDQDMRQVLARLAALADETGCTVLLLRHLNKGKGDPLYRGGGSIGIVGAARAGLLVAPDPDDESTRVLAAVKSNLAPLPDSLTYRLMDVPERGAARVEWVGTSQHDAYALLASHDREEKTTEAEQWLEDYLTEHGRVRSRDAKDEARKQGGFSKASIDRAASKLNVVVEPEGFPRITYWSLPAPTVASPHPSTDATDATDATGRDQHRSTGVTDATGQLHHDESADATGQFTPPTGPGRCEVCG